MLVTFRIVDTETLLHSVPAPLNARELAALCQLLREKNLLPDLDEGEIEGTAYKFEVSANTLALATFARVLDFRTDIIAVVEEAQFLGRSLRVERDGPGADPVLRVSEHIALTPDLMMARDIADKLMQALELDPSETRSLRLDHLRDLLRDPATFRAFDELGIKHLFDALARLAFVDCGDQMPALEWA